MKKSIWIFLLAVLLPGFVLGWLALRSAEEQQIIFERRTAELYQKETESLAARAREIVETERRNFGDTVHRLLARSDAEALARDFSNSLMDSWPRKAVGFVLGPEGQMMSPTTSMAAKNGEWRQFLWDNGSFLCSTQPAVVYPVPVDAGNTRFAYNQTLKARANQYSEGKPALAVGKGGETTILAQKGGAPQQQQQVEQDPQLFLKQPLQNRQVERPSEISQTAPQSKKEASANEGALGVNRSMVRGNENVGQAGGVAANAGAQAPLVEGAFEQTELAKQKAQVQWIGDPKSQATRGTNENSAATRSRTSAPSDQMVQVEALPEKQAKEEAERLVRGRPPLAPNLTNHAPPPPTRRLAEPPPPAPSTPMPALAPAPPSAPAPAPMVPPVPAPVRTVDSGTAKPPDASPEASAPIPQSAPIAPGAASPPTRGQVTRGIETSVPPAQPMQRAEPPRPEDPQVVTATPPSTRQKADQVEPRGGGKPGDAPSAEEKSAQVQVDAAQTAEALGQGMDKKVIDEAVKDSGKLAVAPAEDSPAGSALQQRAVQPDQKASMADLNASPLNPSAAQTFGGIPENSVASNAPANTQTSFYSRNSADLNNRMVEPQQQTRSVTSNWSAILPATADFRALTANSEEGMLARFVQDKLDLIFWLRPPEAPEMVFGCLVEASDLGDLWKELFANHVSEERSERPAYVLALLDDKAHPVTTFPKIEKGRDWKRPFVASEVGEVLPHWEAALYLATPTAMADTARGLRRTLSFTIAAAIALIAIGGWLVVADVRRQLALAQQKTDFVSNVSHELKTPLTSIRMFAELMHDRPPPAEKQGQYLRIITVEAERLTRLINNVLDFAKLERRQKRFDKKSLDLCGVITRVWEGHEMHLRDAGFQTRWEAAPGPYPVLGDEDALAQILVNLLSNAEKYSQERKEVDLVTWTEKGWIHVSVLDRGMGVPDGEERKIFEAFYRAHDSLSSGIQGSGLGLTLAQRLAREHGGEIVFARRQDGGSRFTLRLPMVNGHEDEGRSEVDRAKPSGAA